MNGIGSTLAEQTVESFPDLLSSYEYEKYSSAWNVGPFPVITDFKTKRSIYKFCLKRVLHNFQVYIDFFVSFGFNIMLNDAKRFHKVYKAMYTIVLMWLSLDIQGRLEDFLKYHTSYLFAKYGKQSDLPETSVWRLPGSFIMGPFKKWLSNRMRDKLADNYRLFWSLMHTKRGCAPLQVKQVVESLKKHAKLMSSHFETPKDLMSSVYEVSFWLGQEATRTYKDFKIPAPSTRACFENSIAHGGSRKEIYNILSWVNHESPESYATLHIAATTHTDKVLADVKSIGASGPFSELSEDVLAHIFSYVPKTYVVIDMPQQLGDPVYNFHTLEEYLMETTLGRIPRATVVAIPEPFKTRVITKSEAVLNYYGKPLQKHLHSILKKTDWCFPIGRPLQPEEDFKRFERLPYGWKIVSGDYASATDRLNGDASVYALRVILDQMPINRAAKDLLLMTLGSQELFYSETINDYKSDPNFVEAQRELPPTTIQTNGQLMGSILSFIVLCLLNAAAFLATCKEYYDDPWYDLRQAVKTHALLINGDDILFQAPQSFIDLWYRKVAELGLIPSLGKNYVSDRFFTINSMLFVRKQVGLNRHTLKYTPFLNMGLLHCTNPAVSKSAIAKDHYALAASAARVQEKYLLGYETDRFVEWLFIHRNQSALSKASLGRNWFVKRELGGLGLRTSMDVKIIDERMSVLQGRIAAAIATRSTPQQVFQYNLSLGLYEVTQETELAMDVVDFLGDNLGWSFGGKNPDEVLLHALQADPFGRGSVMKEKDLRKQAYRVSKNLKSLSQECGSLAPMKYSSTVDFVREEPGLDIDTISIESSLKGTVYLQ